MHHIHQLFPSCLAKEILSVTIYLRRCVMSLRHYDITYYDIADSALYIISCIPIFSLHNQFLFFQ